MTARNEITGDSLTTKRISDAFRDGWERIFGKKSLLPENTGSKNELTSEQKLARHDLDPH